MVTVHKVLNYLHLSGYVYHHRPICHWIGLKQWRVNVQVLILAAVRIRNLCEHLGQSQQLIERVYGVFQHTLQRQTSLFFNRHIDQLILCSIYGVCKVSAPPWFYHILVGHVILVFTVSHSEQKGKAEFNRASLSCPTVSPLNRRSTYTPAQCNCPLVRSVVGLLAQVSKVTVTFRDIIHQYRMQPQCKFHVFRNVFIDLPPWQRNGVCTLQPYEMKYILQLEG